MLPRKHSKLNGIRHEVNTHLHYRKGNNKKIAQQHIHESERKRERESVVYGDDNNMVDEVKLRMGGISQICSFLLTHTCVEFLTPLQ
jgi:hypothetical protein